VQSSPEEAAESKRVSARGKPPLARGATKVVRIRKFPMRSRVRGSGPVFRQAGGDGLESDQRLRVGCSFSAGRCRRRRWRRWIPNFLFLSDGCMHACERKEVRGGQFIDPSVRSA